MLPWLLSSCALHGLHRLLRHHLLWACAKSSWASKKGHNGKSKHAQHVNKYVHASVYSSMHVPNILFIRQLHAYLPAVLD